MSESLRPFARCIAELRARTKEPERAVTYQAAIRKVLDGKVETVMVGGRHFVRDITVLASQLGVELKD